jgi:hypothetical protein
VFSKNVVELLKCWKMWFNMHRCGRIWNGIMLCIMLSIWCEKNNQTFVGVENPGKGSPPFQIPSILSS